MTGEVIGILGSPACDSFGGKIIICSHFVNHDNGLQMLSHSTNLFPYFTASTTKQSVGTMWPWFGSRNKLLDQASNLLKAR